MHARWVGNKTDVNIANVNVCNVTGHRLTQKYSCLYDSKRKKSVTFHINDE